MVCLGCKKPIRPNLAKSAKYCSVGCDLKARERLKTIIDGLKREKRPWGEVIRGDGEKD